jgi:hypothetical protein
MAIFEFYCPDKKSGAEGGGEGEGVNDPKMMAAMAQMEKAMSGMDEDNPDPRQMGQLMRKMAEMTGESLTGEMEEMVRKLEGGADPEGFEEAFGDFIGDEDAGESGGIFRGPPLKDDTLYDFE